MKTLDGTVDMDGFFGSLARAPVSALMLDYDGTLAPFVVNRDEAFPYPGVRERLRKIMASTGTRLVIISGRAAADMPALLGIEPMPEVWGSHGRERVSPDGKHKAADLDPSDSDALDKAKSWARSIGQAERLEVKPAGVAFHIRGLDGEAARQLIGEARRVLGGISRGCSLLLHEFDGGLELRPGGMDKGHAVRTLMAETAAGASAAYLGDDTTDEDAFRELKGRGPGILGILVRPEFRRTEAGLWLKPPGELMWFLDRWAEATG